MKEDDNMFCTKCGNQNSDNAKFCSKCGNAIGIPDVQNVQTQFNDIPMKRRISGKTIAILITIALLVIGTIISVSVSLSSKKRSDTGINSGSDFADNNSDVTNDVTYTHSSVLSSKKLSADQGSGKLVCKTESYLNSLITIPDFAVWSNNEIPFMSSNTGWLYYSKKCGSTPDKKLVEKYISVLEKDYGFSTQIITAGDPDDFIGSFEYEWECSKDNEKINIKLHGLTGGYEEYLEFSYSDKIRIVKGEEIPETTVESYSFTPEYYSDTVDISGWNASDSLIFKIDSSLCKKGNSFGIDKFNKSKSGLSLTFNTTKIGSYGYITSDYYEDIRLEILDDNSGYPAIYFYIVINDKDSTRYYLEGICAPDKKEIPSNDSQNNQSGGNNSNPGINVPNIYPGNQGGRMCAVCYGTGRMNCHTCGGDGKNSCTICHGTGIYRNYGQSSTCINCSGTGNITCTKCYGAGNLKCTGCNGTGKC